MIFKIAAIFFLFAYAPAFANPISEDSFSNEERTFFRLIDADCDIENTFFQKNFSKVGHVVKFSINGKELVNDSSVWNPQNPTQSSPVVGIIEIIRWDGKRSDNIEISMRVSAKNKALLQEYFCSSKGDPQLEVEWVLYEYDHAEKKYFRSFYTDTKPVKLTIGKDNLCYISRDIDRYNPNGFYIIELALSPVKGAEEQELSFAFRAGGKTFTRKIYSSEIKEDNL